MRKLLISRCLAILLGSNPLWAIVPVHSDQTIQTIEAKGEASGGRNQTVAELERLALADARRKALEQAGTALSATSLVKNSTLTQDQIRIFAEGVVKVLEVKNKHIHFDEASQTFYVTLAIRAEVQSLDAKELLQRLEQTRKAESAQALGLSFGFNLIAWQPVIGQSRGIRIKTASSTGYSRVELRDGGKLSSGAEFQIHVTPQQDAYFYLLNVDSHGLLFPLLPHPQGRSDNFLKAGQTYVLPDLNNFYQLDDHTGPERIYVLASRTKQQDIEYLIQRSLQNPDGLELAEMLKASVNLRESSSIEVGQEQKYQISDQVTVPLIAELVKGKTHAIRVFSFQHQ